MAFSLSWYHQTGKTDKKKPVTQSKNEQIMRIILLIILLYLVNCGGGFDAESADAQDIKKTILGPDSSEALSE